MLIALLAVLGVDLIVLVVLLAFVLARKRWVKRQPESFRGVIRLSGGELDGFRSKWSRGYGRWISDVLVWTKGPFLFRNAFVIARGLDDERPARSGEVKRLGDQPVVIQLTTGAATVEVAAPNDERERLLGPYGQSIGQRSPPKRQAWPRDIRDGQPDFGPAERADASLVTRRRRFSACPELA